jgi:predicted lactoylglutathione lyase
MKSNIILFILMALQIFLNCRVDSEMKSIRHLGDYVQISLAVEELDSSLSFYKKLGFTEIEIKRETQIPWAIITDGFNIFMLSQNDFPSPTFTYYGRDGEKRIQVFQNRGLLFHKIFKSPAGNVTALTADPNGLNLTLIDFNSSKLPTTSGVPDNIIGKFSQLAIPSKDLQESLQFWQKAGFTLLENQAKYAKLSDNLITIGLYQNQEMDYKILIYHSQDLKKVRKNILDAGISLENAYPEKNDLISFQSPDGQKIIIKSGELGLVF